MDMMTVVIPYDDKNQRGLFLAVKSICKYSWLRISVPITDLNVPEIVGNKALNIHNKIMFACSLPANKVSDTFILMSDDHYLLSPFDPEPPYESIIAAKMSNYVREDIRFKCFQNTLLHLSKRGLPTRNYDLHYPVVINKKDYLRIMSDVDWTLPGGHAIKSLYFNTLGIVGRPDRDCKIKVRASSPAHYEKMLSGKRWFSTGDEAQCPALWEYLEYLYP